MSEVGVVAVFRRIEIENAAVLFPETSVIVEAEAGAEAEIGPHLKLVLQIPARLVRAIVAVGIALQEGSRDESVCGIGDR